MLHPLLKNLYSLHLVSTLARHWPSPLTHQDAARITQGPRLVADKLANGKEPKEARQGCAIAIAIFGRWLPGFFWLEKKVTVPEEGDAANDDEDDEEEDDDEYDDDDDDEDDKC